MAAPGVKPGDLADGLKVSARTGAVFQFAGPVGEIFRGVER